MRISDCSSYVFSSDLFHNCPYEGVWKDNKRRWSERTPMWDILHKYGHDYKLVFVGDASMSAYEISHPGGSVEHFNEEAGAVWLQRMANVYPAAVWLNPDRKSTRLKSSH